jgi:four helix bundle protein
VAGSVQSHRDLIVWQKSMNLVEEVYRLAARFPASENYRLTAQITRAAASVPANIAEGRARSSRKEYAWFLSVAKGSLMETDTFLSIAVRLGYLSDELTGPAFALVAEVSKMLTAEQARVEPPVTCHAQVAPVQAILRTPHVR